jgi:hypothetical protein
VCALALVVLVAAALPVSASALSTSTAVLYKCEPADAAAAAPPPLPQLPAGGGAASDTTAREDDHLSEPCPSGDVPYPSGTTAFPKPPPPHARGISGGARFRQVPRTRHANTSRAHGRAHAAREKYADAPEWWYSHSVGQQSFPGGANVAGEFVEQSNEDPYIEYKKTGETGAHSLAQYWAIAEYEGKLSDVEEGWSESWGQFGDVEPHLFIFAFDSGVGLGYVGSTGGPSWVQVSKTIYPNMKLSYDDTWHTYGTEIYNNAWWIYYDGEWVGYLPVSDWTRFPLQWLNRLEAGGEVASPESEEWTCTNMGHNGEYGTQSLAAEFQKVW